MPPKTKKTKSQTSKGGEMLLHNMESAALKPEIRIPQTDSKDPQFRLFTDSRIQLTFANREVDFNVDSTRTISHGPLALSDALIISFITPENALLDPRSIFLRLRCSIKQIDKNTNQPKELSRPIRKSIRKAGIHESVKLGQEVELDDGRKLPLLTTATKPVAVDQETITGIGVSPSPLFGLTMFKNIRVKIGRNGMEIPNSARDLYYYQAYIMWLLTVKRNALTQLERNCGFILDTSMETDPFKDFSSGVFKRYSKAANSKIMDFYIPFHVDGFTNVENAPFLPPSLPITIEFEKANNDICLCSNVDERFHIQVDDISLQCQYTILTNRAVSAYENTLSKIRAMYTYMEHMLSYKIVPAGSTTYRTQLQDIDSHIPQFILVGYMPWSSFSGSLDKNAFWFDPQNIKKITLSHCDGMKPKELAVDWTGDNWTEFYNHFLSELDVPFFSGEHELIKFKDYARGFHFFAIDNTRNHKAGDIDSIPVNGKLKITFEWAERTSEDLVLLLINFDKKGYTIDSARDMRIVSLSSE